MNVSFLPAIIICVLLMIYGIFVFNGKLLWFLKDYNIRFKDEVDEKKREKTYRKYGIIIVSISILLSIICFYQYFMGIDTIKNVLH
jgi:amino acid transporter